MKFKSLGNTNVQIPFIGQGCMGLGGRYKRDDTAESDQIKILRLGIDLGMNFLDTAEVYAEGNSEEIIGKAVKGSRDQVFIASKFSPEHNTYEQVLKAADRSLARLGTDYIDLYQIHWPNPQVPIEETLRALNKLVDQGKVRFIGLSNFSVEEVEAASAFSKNIVSLQCEYNLFERTAEDDAIPYCEKNKLTFIGYSPLDQGRVADHPKKLEKLQKIVQKYEKTPAQITLNWLVRNLSVIAIPKASSEKHLRENAASVDFTLDEQDSREIERIFSGAVTYVPVDKIRVVSEAEASCNSGVYQTLEDAIANKLNLVPSPNDLAKDILDGKTQKPVRLRKSDPDSPYEFDLINGRVRYWAWVIAFRGKKPIPALVRYS